MTTLILLLIIVEAIGVNAYISSDLSKKDHWINDVIGNCIDPIGYITLLALACSMIRDIWHIWLLTA